MNNKKTVSLVLVLVFILSTFTSAFAATGDLTAIKDSTVTRFADWTFDDDLFSLITFGSEGYEIEVGEKNYNLDRIMTIMLEGNTLEEAATKIDAEETQDKLKVVDVSAINGTKVTVNVTGDTETVKASDFTVMDSNGGVYAVVNVVKAEDGVYDLILGTPVKGVGTLTVKSGTSEAIKAFNTEIEGINLSIEVADEDNVLVADGADNTIITVKVLRDGLVDENFKGAVKFMSLKGARFAKEEVAFDKGVAKVQLNSISSAILIEDTIIATISDAEDTDAVGKQVRTNIVYNPEGGSDDELAKRVFLTYAESNTASNLFLKFNDEFNFDEFRKAFKQNDINIIIKRTRDNTPIATNTLIHDVVKLDSKTVKVVLKEEGALIDNAEINVEVKGNGTIDSMIQDFNIDFNFVDSTPSTAVNVQAVEYDVLEAQFTEAVAKASATKFSNWVLNGTKLSNTHVEKIEIGILDNQFTSVVYDNVNQKDNRMFATITLTPAGVKLYRGEGKTNLLQAYNIADYAEVTDGSGQNIATTQEFEFKTPALPEAGKVEFVQQSVEQFKLDFGEVVNNAVLVETELVDGKVPASDKGTIIVERKTTNAAGEVVWVLMNSTKADNEVALNHDGNGVYYLELKQDWTVTLDTDGSGDNYYKPGFNELRVTVRNVEKDADGEDLPDADKIQITSDRTGTAIAKNVKVFNLELDTSAPKFEEVKQSKNALDKFLASVDIDFNEPVKFPGFVNTEGDTASQQQDTQGGVPVPTFEFVSADRKTTLEGKMSGLTEDDMFFVVEPKTGTLTAGEWDVIVRSISDDVGNTSDTLVKRITIVTAEAVAKKEIPAVLWAEAYNDVYSTLADKTAGKVSDVVFIQFGAEMSVDAFKSAFYQINDKNLPEGVNITKSETIFVPEVKVGNKVTVKEVAGTLIKIELPSTFYSDKDTDGNEISGLTTPQMLNINKRLETEAGVVINSPTEIEMSYLRTPKTEDYAYSVMDLGALEVAELLGGLVEASTPPVTEIKVSAVTASNDVTGDKLDVVLTDIPTTVPTATSVKVTRTIDGTIDGTFTFNGGTSNWNEDTKTLTITKITPVVATTTEQKVVYSVAYGNTVAVKANELTVVASVDEVAQAKATKKAEAEALLEGLTETEYTPESWKALTDAIEADKVAIEAFTTVEDVEGYTLTAIAAKEELAKPVEANVTKVTYTMNALGVAVYTIETDVEGATKWEIAMEDGPQSALISETIAGDEVAELKVTLYNAENEKIGETLTIVPTKK